MFFRSQTSELVVWLGPRVLRVLRNSAQTQPRSPERGGQVFGDFDGTLVRCRVATRDGLHTRRARTSLVVDREHERREIGVMFDRGLHFIGTWHTHPEPAPVPSSTDEETCIDQFRRSQHNLRRMLLVVVGTGIGADGIWLGTVDARRVERLD